MLAGCATTLGTMPGSAPPSASRSGSIVLPPLVLGVILIGDLVLRLLRDARARAAGSSSSRPTRSSRSASSTWDNLSEILDGAVVERQDGAHRSRRSPSSSASASPVIMSQTKLAERAIFPYMVILQAIPILAIVPLIGFWFGYDQTVARDGVRDHLDLPDHRQHAVRAAVGRPGHARPVHAAPRRTGGPGSAS